ncbi:hypothetical protein GCM10010129_02160 [Streptomyces fumigatiscleroticus]|nr:hypothetical protein GCM10010129_02160 [Streptomyces fumigatiscleroticus]
MTLAVLAAAVPGPVAAGAADTTPAGPQSREIASSVLGGDYRMTLTAVRSTGDRYAASVRLRVFVPAGDGWRESDRATVGAADGWFWYPLTGKGAVCRFSVSGRNPAPVGISLLITPSIGCSRPRHFVVESGTIRTG